MSPLVPHATFVAAEPVWPITIHIPFEGRQTAMSAGGASVAFASTTLSSLLPAYTYSRASCGVGVGSGAASGFQLLDAFFGSSFPNHPVLRPVIGSVDGSHPFDANTPSTSRNIATDTPIRAKSHLRFPTA